MASIPDGPKVGRIAATNSGNTVARPAAPPQDVGQNLRDRTIGRAVTGEIGMS